MVKTPQIAEQQLVMTMDKAQETELQCFLLTSAKAKKFQHGDRSMRLYTTISLQLRRFSKIATIVYKDSRSFYSWVHQEAKRSILQDYELTDRQTHTQKCKFSCCRQLGHLHLAKPGCLCTKQAL